MNNSEILDHALNVGREQQEQELVIDFDQALEEAKKKAIKVKFKGEVYNIPADTPMWYSNLVNRKLHKVHSLPADMSDEEVIEQMAITDEENKEIYRRLFGDGFVSEYLEGDESNWVNLKNFNEDLLQPILKQWGWAPITDTTKKKKTPDL